MLNESQLQSILDDAFFDFEQQQHKSAYADVLKQSKDIFIGKMQKTPLSDDAMELETNDVVDLGCDALQAERDLLPILNGAKLGQQIAQYIPSTYTAQQTEHIKSILTDLFPKENQLNPDAILFVLGFIAKLNESCKETRYKDAIEKAQNILLVTYGLSLFESNLMAKANKSIYFGMISSILTAFISMGLILALNKDSTKFISSWYTFSAVIVGMLELITGVIIGKTLRDYQINSIKSKNNVEAHIIQAKQKIITYWQSPVINHPEDTDNSNNNNNQITPINYQFWNSAPSGDFLIDNLNEILMKTVGVFYAIEPNIQVVIQAAPSTAPQATI